MNKRQRKKTAKKLFCVTHKSIYRMYRNWGSDSFRREIMGEWVQPEQTEKEFKAK